MLFKSNSKNLNAIHMVETIIEEGNTICTMSLSPNCLSKLGDKKSCSQVIRNEDRKYV